VKLILSFTAIARLVLVVQCSGHWTCRLQLYYRQ